MVTDTLPAAGSIALPPLSTRLLALAEWVPCGSRIADIGTDHGYLPIWLLLQGRITGAIAGDLRPGPLERARKNGHAFAVDHQIDYRLCNGLSAIQKDEADTVVIAGMGGENIAAILAAAPWTADGQHTLLLSPHTKAELLRSFLSEHNYRILRERLVEDRGTLYPILEVTGGTMMLTVGQIYGGAALINDPLGDRYLIENILRLQGAVAGLNHSRRKDDELRADTLREIMTALLVMREEWRHVNRSYN